mgnify:CR=1 FL=1
MKDQMFEVFTDLEGAGLEIQEAKDLISLIYEQFDDLPTERDDKEETSFKSMVFVNRAPLTYALISSINRILINAQATIKNSLEVYYNEWENQK